MGGDGAPRELGAGLHGWGLPQLPGLVVCLPVTLRVSPECPVCPDASGNAQTVGLDPGMSGMIGTRAEEAPREAGSESLRETPLFYRLGCFP